MFDDFLICIFRIKKCEMFLSLCDNFKFSKSEGDGFYLIGYFDLTWNWPKKVIYFKLL